MEKLCPEDTYLPMHLCIFTDHPQWHITYEQSWQHPTKYYDSSKSRGFMVLETKIELGVMVNINKEWPRLAVVELE